mmetsp:Transcript_95681/g.219255  ORF Transcript_95681/g.219255 Transcript_95681/m.219255 type:complete len:256 (-) Transcript_95681:398-1165(-)
MEACCCKAVPCWRCATAGCQTMLCTAGTSGDSAGLIGGCGDAFPTHGLLMPAFTVAVSIALNASSASSSALVHATGSLQSSSANFAKVTATLAFDAGSTSSLAMKHSTSGWARWKARWGSARDSNSRRVRARSAVGGQRLIAISKDARTRLAASSPSRNLTHKRAACCAMPTVTDGLHCARISRAKPNPASAPFCRVSAWTRRRCSSKICGSLLQARVSTSRAALTSPAPSRWRAAAATQSGRPSRAVLSACCTP